MTVDNYPQDLDLLLLLNVRLTRGEARRTPRFCHPDASARGIGRPGTRARGGSPRPPAPAAPASATPDPAAEGAGSEGPESGGPPGRAKGRVQAHQPSQALGGGHELDGDGAVVVGSDEGAARGNLHPGSVPVK